MRIKSSSALALFRLSTGVTLFKILFLIGLLVIVFSCAQDNILGDTRDKIAIDSISPMRGPVGTQVRVYGKGFDTNPKGNVISVNGVMAEILSPTSLSALLIKIPAGAQTGNVKLKVNEKEITGPVFTIIDPPVFRDVKPTSGYAGTIVTLTGSGFLQVSSVLFNGVPATIRVKENERLEVSAPVSTTGNIVLDYGYGQITAPVFTYLPVPLVRNVSDGGKGVMLAASYINPTTAALRVTYNGIAANILGVFDVVGNTGNVLPAYPPDDIENPFDIVLSSNGIPSLPYRYTITPIVDRATYSIVSSDNENITYDITLYGKYFDTAPQGNKAIITFFSRLASEVPSTVQSWTATKIVTRVTVDVFWSIGGTGAYRDYYGSVMVNGVVSNRAKL